MLQRDGLIEVSIRADFAVPRRTKSPLPFLSFVQEATGRVEPREHPFRMTFDRLQMVDHNVRQREPLQLAGLLRGELQKPVREPHMLPAEIVQEIDRSGSIRPEQDQRHPPKSWRGELLSSWIGRKPTGRPEPLQLLLGDNLPLKFGSLFDQP